jgi:hypothetical protein
MPPRKAKSPRGKLEPSKAKSLKGKLQSPKAKPQNSKPKSPKAKSPKAKSPKEKSLKAKPPKAKPPKAKSPLSKEKSLPSKGNVPEAENLKLEEAQIKKFEDDVVVKELCSFFSKKQKARQNFQKFIEGTLGEVFSDKNITDVNMEILKEEFKEILQAPAKLTDDVMLLKYRDLLAKIPIVDLNLWKSEKYMYKNMKVLQQNGFRIVFSADQYEIGKKIKNEVVIKCFIKVVDKSEPEDMEFTVLDILNQMKCSVPNLFETFETTYFRCYPTEKLEQILSKMNKLEGFGIKTTKEVGKVVASIFKKIHKLGCYYGDLSLNNIGYLNGKPCLIDFGEVGRLGFNTIEAVTLRYAPRSYHRNYNPEFKNDPPLMTNEKDDYEELGLVLLDICYWDNSFPGFVKYTGETVNFVIDTFKNSKKKDAAHVFFKKYFTILENTENSKIDEAIEVFFQNQK